MPLPRSCRDNVSIGFDLIVGVNINAGWHANFVDCSVIAEKGMAAALKTLFTDGLCVVILGCDDVLRVVMTIYGLGWQVSRRRG
jgi:hypothetical protein